MCTRLRCASKAAVAVTLVCLALVNVQHARAEFELGPREWVQADGADIVVPGYSVPSLAHWDNDGLEDLIVGEALLSVGKVRVYLNVGTAGSPAFADYFYAQSDGADLTVAASGCLSCFPRVVYWDADDRKDLLVGQANGTVSIYLNIGTDDSPTFDGGTKLQVGEPGAKVNIDVGSRATSTVVDWDSDGRKDLVIGAIDGRIHLFLNEGTDSEPDFRSETFAQKDGADLVVSSVRSSPHVVDLDGDGLKDLLTGNTNGQLLLYRNVGTNTAPSFSGYTAVKANGSPLDLPGSPRSRPFVCMWDGDPRPDVLIGASGGKVRLYHGLFERGDMNCDGAINSFDIDGFLLVLGAAAPDYSAYYAVYPDCDHLLGDLDENGLVNGFDIDEFVDALGGG